MQPEKRQTASRIASDYAKPRSRPHHAVIRVYDEAGDVIETHEHKGEFKEP
jgi:3-deoxy-D-arabino-heptulosonate 7-phosphate (DAHP) synthase class II